MKRPRKCRRLRRLQTLLDVLVGPLRNLGAIVPGFYLVGHPPFSPEQLDASSHAVRWACMHMCLGVFFLPALKFGETQALGFSTRSPVVYIQLLSG